jgi:hypothetical protein
VIKANDDLTPEHHQFFLYQMLRALKYIHTGEYSFIVVFHSIIWQTLLLVQRVPATSESAFSVALS